MSVNGPAVEDQPWLWGTNCGDAKCHRWSPWTKCGSCAWSEETIKGCHTWSRGTDCGGIISSVTGHYGENGGFCKHKFISLHNKAAKVIYSLPRSDHASDVGIYHLTCTGQWEGMYITESSYLLKVTQTVQYLVGPGLLLWEDGNDTESWSKLR